MKELTTEQLRRLDGQEGLVIQGCGGSLQEWIDGINDLLTEAQILCGGSKFRSEEVAVFQQDRITGGDCPSYDAALGIIGEYVNITGPDEPEQGHLSGMTMQ